MIKIMMSAALAVGLLSTQTFAKDSNMYVGFDLGNTKLDMKAITGVASTTVSDDDNSQTLKLGNYIDENTRAYLYYQNINVDGGDGYSYGIGFDFLIGSYDLKPFVGVIIGKTGITDDMNSNYDLEGLSYGGQIGLNYSIGNNFSFDAGYRYLISNAKTTVSGVILETDAIKNWYLGANYKF